MYYTMKCGCVVDVDVYIDYGCCELCGESADVENVEFVSNCNEHGGTE